MKSKDKFQIMGEFTDSARPSFERYAPIQGLVDALNKADLNIDPEESKKRIVFFEEREKKKRKVGLYDETDAETKTTRYFLRGQGLEINLRFSLEDISVPMEGMVGGEYIAQEMIVCSVKYINNNNLCLKL